MSKLDVSYVREYSRSDVYANHPTHHGTTKWLRYTVTLGGVVTFRVTDGDAVVYDGSDLAAAVAAYNDL